MISIVDNSSTERGERMTDSTFLELKIKAAGYSIKGFSKKVGISRSCFYNKLKNTAEFKASEIMRIAEMLSLTDSEKEAIFFAGLVDKSST